MSQKKMSETLIRDLGAKSHLDAVLATVGQCGRGCASLISAVAKGTWRVPWRRWVQTSQAMIRLSKRPSRPPMAPGSFVWSGQRPMPFPNRINRPISSCLFSRFTMCRARSLRGRLPRRGGFCGHRVAFMSPSRCRKGRINTLWSCSTTKPRYENRLPRRLKHFARPRFAIDQISTYADARRYCNFEAFAEQMIANMRFNGYSKEAVLAPAVRRRFDETFAASGDKFDQPVRIDCFGPAS